MDFKIIIYALLIFLGLSAKSYSRIGETKNECIKRYGAVIGSDKEAGIQIHMKGGFSIAIQFVDNFVGSIAFQKMKEDILGQHEEISDNEIEITAQWAGISQHKRYPDLVVVQFGILETNE